MNLDEKYKNIRQQTLNFCSHLQAEDYSIQVVQFASPAKWHLAHTTWFFETFILKNEVANYTEFDSNFNFLFNSYYNNVGDRVLQANRGNMSRPSTDEIFSYRNYVDEKMLDYLQQDPSKKIIDLVVLGLNHEQQHQELLITDVKYMLGHNALFPVFDTAYNLIKDKNATSESIKINAGVYEIGHQSNEFSYDNELGVHQVYIDDFEINNHLVTNEEFIEFIESGAYSDFNLWLDEGWSWVNSNKIDSPMYWHKIDGTWHAYTLAGLQKIDSQALLCHINFYEANAFAEWKGMRLPTEFEWEIAAKKLDWGKRWEWTNSAYLPYPNFVKENGAVGEYNGKFMSNKMVLRGASVATSKNHSRITYRNFFHPSERWQFTGIRLVK
ncbi:ergothioneine biosynthesis protein EgtB [Aurantibacter crassamenti]|uniref:ergothioneine biosynthesis protein EgtB n=1 Tax=Aurantibacter crassamenti TaxID=1837375 RepID=UPI001939D378|nr:ergothioneine biosynthesis protein EgtB [Aurantibacter crassamenti]MBM1108233.1 ergothioneine biosynthesis protein EgtB [Aurantibacter crassamenti]